MADTASRTKQGIHWISDDEAHAIFDAEARDVMGMSGEEFLRRYDAGDFADVHREGEDTDFTELELLLPFGR